MSHLKSIVHLATRPSPEHLVLLLAVLLGTAAVAFLFARLTPTTIFSLGVAAEVFAGDWSYMHIPVPVDRVILLFGLGSLLLGGSRQLLDRKLVLAPAHVLMFALVIYATLSALWAGTLTQKTGFYALLDRLGVIPFLMFTLAPLVYRTAKQRDTLLRVMVVLGFYLGVVALGEGLNVHELVQPSYILNPNLGIHFGRARGPFLESVADGLSMFMCAAAAGVALTTWKSKWARRLCWATIAMSGAGAIFTLTRSIWIGNAVGAILPLLFDKKWRRRVPYLVVGMVVFAVAIINFVPGLSGKVSSRADSASPVWDRLNTNDAALRAWEQHPIFGIGWEEFEVQGPNYLRQANTYPLTGAGLEVHNVPLSHLVELGIPGFLMWVVALVTIVGGAAFRRGPPHMHVWRLAMIGIFVAYLVAANLGPMSYPFPNLILWLWAGIVAAERYSTPRHPHPDREASEPAPVEAPGPLALERPLVVTAPRIALAS